jgi:hypothetical protein
MWLVQTLFPNHPIASDGGPGRARTCDLLRVKQTNFPNSAEQLGTIEAEGTICIMSRFKKPASCHHA